MSRINNKGARSLIEESAKEKRQFGGRRVRAQALAFALIAMFGISGWRAFGLSIRDSGSLKELATRQRIKSITLKPSRGTIFDRNGAVLAQEVTSYSIAANPKLVTDLLEYSKKLSPILGIPSKDLQEKLSRNAAFVWLKRQSALPVAMDVKTLGFAGIDLIEEGKRFYPNFTLASHIVGFTGLDGEGMEGIEKSLDAILLGIETKVQAERDAKGQTLLVSGINRFPDSGGLDVNLTLDKTIQHILESELEYAVEETSAKAGMGVVMDPKTGEVLAMASYPFYDPNNISGVKADARRNRAICDEFEPGSTMKAFLAASAIDSEAASPDDRLFCENGKYMAGLHIIHDPHPYSVLTFSEVIKYSSNIGAAKVSERLGKRRLYSYLKAFGFGDKTGIELAGERRGTLRDQKVWSKTDLRSIGFGQGITATALQLAAAMGAIANGGVLMKPTIVKGVVNREGFIEENGPPKVVRKVVSEKTAKTVSGMLEGVTAEGGTGVRAKMAGFRVAGKTGTGQKASERETGYSESERTSSFVGFVPADDPRLVIAIIVDEPSGSPYGGVVAAPAFRKVAERSLYYLGIRSESMPVINVKEGSKAVHVSFKVEPEEIEDSEEGTVDKRHEEGRKVPDFRGMTMREVIRSGNRAQIEIELSGSGMAVDQNPGPGRRLKPGRRCQVEFVPSV